MHPKAHFDRSTRRGQEEFAGTGSRGSRCACATPTNCSGRALAWWTRRSGSALGAAASSMVEQRHLERSRTPPRHRRRLVDRPHLGQRWHGEREQQHASVPLRRVRAGEVRWEEFLYDLKAGPAGGRLRRPSSAGSDTRPGRWLAPRATLTAPSQFSDIGPTTPSCGLVRIVWLYSSAPRTQHTNHLTCTSSRTSAHNRPPSRLPNA